MKEVRRIKYTGKNLNDVFPLPCVISIKKYEDEPCLILDRHMMVGIVSIAMQGDELIEYSNGEWEITPSSSEGQVQQ